MPAPRAIDTAQKLFVESLEVGEGKMHKDLENEMNVILMLGVRALIGILNELEMKRAAESRTRLR